MLKKVLALIGVIAVVSVIGSANATANATTVRTSNSGVVELAAFQGLTSGQANAVRAAKQYLSFSAFSRSGLIEQLRFEGYSKKNATFAVDYITVSWKNQAYKSARAYLRLSPFSLSGLIEQLEFEGFTYKQAAYGANRAL